MTLISKLQDLLGENNVLINADDRISYEQDMTGKYTSLALAVVRPKNTAEVAGIMKLASQTKTTVIPLGGNTGLTGAGYAGTDETALILSLSRMNEIQEINHTARTATVQSGVILETLHQAVEAEGFIFPLTFGAKGSCQIGGTISTNAGGSNVLRYGNTRDLCLGIEVVTPQGEVINLMTALHKNNTGLDLKNLYIGSEGVLGIVTAAIVKLFPKPTDIGTAMVSVSSMSAALKLLHQLKDRTNNGVDAFEYMPAKYMSALKEKFPERTIPLENPEEVNVLIEISLSQTGNMTASEILEDVLSDGFEKEVVLDATLAQNERQRKELWECREAALEVIQLKPPYIITDIALPLDHIDDFLIEMKGSLQNIAPGSEAIVVSHLGDGNLHYSIWLDPEGTGQNLEAAEDITIEIETVTKKLGGTFSAEHGIGIYKLDSMRRWKDPIALETMRTIKAALDPLNILNPGKLIPDA